MTDASPSALMIGVFDGVHRGHQSLIGHGVRVAREQGLRAVVTTFEPNPLEVLRPQSAPTRLCSVRRRAELIAGLGVDEVVVLPFNAELASMSAEVFAQTVVVGRFNARLVVVGKGFRFGHRAQGTSSTLQAAGIAVDEIALVGSDGAISSTRVRAAVGEGDMQLAATLLGRPHEVEGQVIRGASRGRDLGFPTANIDHHWLAAVPADGVYAGLVGGIDGIERPAAISVGSNPTFASASRTVEAHILDYDADLYGRTLRVAFLQRLRGMLAFESVDSLVSQMELDVAHAREVLHRHHVGR